MDLQTLFLASVVAIVTASGLYATYLYGRSTKAFRWSEYVLFVGIPIVGVGIVVYWYGLQIVTLFVASAAIGFCLEYVFGFAYHQILGRRLWTYSRYSLNGYTSVLAIPLWGVAGVHFFLLAKIFGL